MPVVTYETMFLLDSNKVASDADATKQQLHHLIERHGGQVHHQPSVGLQPQAVVRDRQAEKGRVPHHLLHDGKHPPSGLERDFHLAEGVILRSMTLKIDPKWHDAIMGVARDDAANGFAVRGMQEEPGVGAGAGVDGIMGLEGDLGGPPREGGPRRRRSESSEKPA